MTRERTYTWADPREVAMSAARVSGIEFLSLVGRGELPLPPALETLGINPLQVGAGWIEFELMPQEWHYNPLGSVHGGVLSTLADTALGCAVHSMLPAGTRYTSLDLTIKFTRAATVDSGPLRCRGELVSIGRRTATAEARTTDSRGRIIAHATTTCLLISDES
ncbi:PaaI family thioesterase [Microbacterium timonense]|uniref:PaaI family thioesterase n=1 Tax=Microbacterium timonense TaxID=2086576 RepID=UPI00190E953B|nr:PaaI family thioesterase [Microbacterium timonense]